MTPTHSSQGMISSMISRNSSRLVFFLRKLYSISVNVSCFIAYTIVALMGVLYHIWNLYGSAD